jgi:hypothetical protein
MEESKKTVIIDAIPQDAIVDIKVSGHFIHGLQLSLLGLSERMGKEKVQQALARFREGKEPPQDLEEQLLFILIALVGESEKAAIAQGKTRKNEYKIEDVAKFMGIDVT